MDPTLLDGQRILVNKFVFARNGSAGFVFHGPERGDIIVFDPPVDNPEDFVKRVFGLPGDEIDIRDGAVYVNGERVEDGNGYTKPGRRTYPLTVPEGEYFVMGDNRSLSEDSRAWGFVPRSHLQGRAILIWWSYQEDREDYLKTRFFQRARSIASKVVNFFNRTRWSRFFNLIH